MNSFSLVHSGALVGVEAIPVQVEIGYMKGEHRIQIVGLPDNAVRESTERVSAALSGSGFEQHKGYIIVNLAPGDLRKEGPMYDLPIGLGMLIAQRKMYSPQLNDYLIAGEISLSGQLRAIRGALPLALLARRFNRHKLLLPAESAQEAALVEEVSVYPVHSLREAFLHLSGEQLIQPLPRGWRPTLYTNLHEDAPDFADVKGQQTVKRAVEVAVAGAHNLIVCGQPGSGKSMLAQRIPSIMPQPSMDEYLEVLTIQSAAGMSFNPHKDWLKRPFRAPHHTVSEAGLLGGGAMPGPGELSLAHNGVLFMDELPEFRRSTLEVLRQPLEDGDVTISRVAGKVTLPCKIMLIAAMNPCPCGHSGDPLRSCQCTVAQIQRYRSRISGPLMDRIDIHVEAPPLPISELLNAPQGESSASIRARVIRTRQIQAERLQSSGNTVNARMSAKDIERYCSLSDSQQKLLLSAMEKLHLSARAYTKILKVARTIADLEQVAALKDEHLLEAIQYRSLDRALVQ